MGNLHPQNEHDASAPRLGFHEIVPGFDGGLPEDHDPEICIPEFDLSQKLMVNERRESATRRQGPGKKQDPVPEAEAESIHPEASPSHEVPVAVAAAVSHPAKPQVSAYRHPVIQRHAIVEDIVRRDIERLCVAS